MRDGTHRAFFDWSAILLLVVGVVALTLLLAFQPHDKAQADPPLSGDMTTPCSSLDPILNYSCHYLDATNGNNANPGTEAAPWQTLSKLQTEQAGWNNTAHAVYFKRGETWISASLNINWNSPAGAYGRYGAYGTGAEPKFTNSAGPQCFRITKGLKLITDLRFENCGTGINVDHTSLGGVLADYIGASTFVDNCIGVSTTNFLSGLENAYGLRVTSSDFQNNNNECNTTTAVNGIGVLVGGKGVHIDNNYFEGQVGACTFAGTCGAAIYVDAPFTTSTMAFRAWLNISKDDYRFVEVGTVSGGWLPRVEENFIYGSLANQRGFTIADDVANGTTSIERNTVSLTGSGSAAFVCALGAGANDCGKVRNNIFKSVNASAMNRCPNEGYNIYHPTPSATEDCTISGTSQQNVDPLLTSATDRHLQSSSPAINAGDPTYSYCCSLKDLDGDYRTVNTQDIGADERP